MEPLIKQFQELLPQPAGQLATAFPFCGALQVAAAGDEKTQKRDIALYFPNRLAQLSVQQINPANTSTDEALIFEPYHTIDYFASQGVKPPSLENPADRFGQQLKSFTDWLKVMKRLPLAEVTRQIPVEKEKQVAELAHHSLDEKQVWTEAMAEVWIKQGERQKAIRIYEKLSLLDPAKSAYFAAKIDSLKTAS
jgi:hypothetical protein